MLYFVALAVAAPAVAAPPEEWGPWIREGHPEWACVQAADGPLCLWPGTFSLDARADGARFDLGIRVDKDMEVALPGGREAWPEDVRANGRNVVVLDRSGVPTAVLTAGTWRLEGSYRWAAMPQGLTLPAALGLVRLRIAGEAVAAPRIDGGVVRLGSGDAPGESRLELDVLRHVIDGVPAVVETRVIVRAAGASREVALGRVLLDGTRAVAIDAQLPTRLGPDGELVIQARPGTWTVQVDAVVQGPLAGLSMRDLPEPWPDNEYWAVTTQDAVRAVTLSGPPGVDPGRTPLPDDWKGLPTYRVSAGETLTFAELRRGQPTPPPNRLTLQRELWLDFDGDGMTARDTLTGEMNRGWRLDLQAPGVLGHAAENAEDQVVTVVAEGGTGVELRNQQLNLLAESRIEATADFPGTRSLPAVGWATDVQSLHSTLHLPDGWSLLHAEGVDHAPGSLVERWSLLDAVLCLLIAAASLRLGGLRAAGAALVAATLTRQLDYAPGWSWLVVLGAAILVKQLGGRSRAVGVGMAGLVAIMAVAAMTFGLLRTSAFSPVSDVVQLGSRSDYGAEDKVQKVDRKMRNISAQQDATAVVQTGPGVPDWGGEVYTFSWDGPVEASHNLRLLLLRPWQQRAVTGLGLGLLALSVWWSLSGLLIPPGTGSTMTTTAATTGRSAGAASLALLLISNAISPAYAEDAPPPWIVGALTERLTPPACHSCVAVPRMAVRVDGSALQILAEVHASAPGTWALPGPTTSWMPAEVRVDGAPSPAMVRRSDGFVLLRLDPGVHRVEISGHVEGQGLALQFGVPPKRLEVDAPGWLVDGVRPDGSADASLSLARLLGESTATELSPRVEVHRFLDLGFPWRIRTKVSRVSIGDRPVSLKVPLLPGEAVTDDGFVVKDGAVAISLGQTGEVQWLSTLAPVDTLLLSAPEGVLWTELWEISCSPVYACAIDGLPPLSYVEDGAWSPRFRPWPGEALTLRVSRREAAQGQTVTVDSVTQEWKPGPRLTEGRLSLSVRSSQGGTLPVSFPEDTQIVRVTIDGTVRPMEGKAGRIELPLQPGHQALLVETQLPWTLADGAHLPPVDIGAPAVNVRTTVIPPQGRWTPVVWGPGQGVTSWMAVRLALLLGAAGLASRIGRDLGPVAWGLLALGMNQLPVPAFVVVAIAVLLLGRAAAIRARLGHPLGNLVLWGAAGLAMSLLVAALVTGLVGQPDMLIDGPGSSRWGMSWFIDQSEGALPQPLVVSLPLWTFRAVMLVWTLWLLSRLGPWFTQFRDALSWVPSAPDVRPPRADG